MAEWLVRLRHSRHCCVRVGICVGQLIGKVDKQPTRPKAVPARCSHLESAANPACEPTATRAEPRLSVSSSKLRVSIPNCEGLSRNSNFEEVDLRVATPVCGICPTPVYRIWQTDSRNISEAPYARGMPKEARYIDSPSECPNATPKDELSEAPKPTHICSQPPRVLGCLLLSLGATRQSRLLMSPGAQSQEFDPGSRAHLALCSCAGGSDFFGPDRFEGG